VSTMLSRKCSFPMGHFTIFPNLYLVLVGDAGMRKTGALKIAKQLIRESKSPLASESVTREALIDMMRDNMKETIVDGKKLVYHPITAAVSELKEFIIQGSERMSSFLTAIWDEDCYEDKTRKQGRIIVPGPYLVLMACCTPDWLVTQMKYDIVTDGLARRIIFVYANERNKNNALPKHTQEQEDAIIDMILECKRISRLKGQFQLTKMARALYETWYAEASQLTLDADKNLKGYFQSKPELVIKLSMCLSACYSDSMIIDDDILTQAIKCFEFIEADLPRVLSGIGRNELKPYMDRLIEDLEAATNGTVIMQDVFRFYNRDLSKQEFNEVVEAIVATGDAEMVKDKQGIIHLRRLKGQATKPQTKVKIWDHLGKSTLPPPAPVTEDEEETEDDDGEAKTSLRTLLTSADRQRLSKEKED
jgi:hypothetical protein